MARLSDSDIARELASLPGWEISGDQMVRLFTFADFRAAMAFVNALADEAEARQHHPDLDIRYNKVLVRLVTHDAGGVTEKDTKLAAVASRLSGRRDSGARDEAKGEG